MTDYTARLIDMGELVSDVAVETKEWSEKLLGPDSDPKALALAVVSLENAVGKLYDEPHNVRRHAHCLIIAIDCARRAGVKPMELFKAALVELRTKQETHTSSLGLPKEETDFREYE